MVAPLRKKSVGQVLVILVTAVNQEEARKIGKGMVNAKLAACANIIPRIQSIYRWKGKVVKAQEVLIILKSTRPSVIVHSRKRSKHMHTYETPEIIALRLRKPDRYIGWIHSETYT